MPEIPGRPGRPLQQLRLRLTAWYMGTLCATLLLLGIGLFAVIRHQFARELDESLHDATIELERAALIRDMESHSAQGNVVDAVEELHVPGRTLFLLDMSGTPIKPAAAASWIQNVSRRAARAGAMDEDRHVAHERTLRIHAERFSLGRTELVAVAVADKVELEDRYASLIAVFGGAAAVALVLVAAGGFLLVGKSAEPIERTIEYLRRFMADAAHELRTPITVLRARADVALEGPHDAQRVQAALKAIAAESTRLGRIVDDLLTLARADTGERPLDRRRVFLDDSVIDAVESATAIARLKGVTVSLGNCEEAPVIGDSALLRQLAMILLDNAVKFNSAGGSVTVSVYATDGEARLVVEDTGAGIPPDQLPHVFERFYRGDSARTRQEAAESAHEGAGLGLSIARWIVEAHGGDVSATSSPGRGSRFVARFPPPTPM